MEVEGIKSFPCIGSEKNIINKLSSECWLSSERVESCHVMTCTLSLLFFPSPNHQSNMMIVNGVFSACRSGIIITNNSSPLMSLACWCFLSSSLSVVRDDQHIFHFSFVCPWSRAYISRYIIEFVDSTLSTLFSFCQRAFIINWLMTSHQCAAPGNECRRRVDKLPCNFIMKVIRGNLNLLRWKYESKS